MKLLKGLLGVVVLLVAVFAAGGMLLPATSHVERSTTIDRPPADVYAMVNSFERFNEWSPWADADPNARYEYSGPPSGVGATLTWSGDPNTVGSGSQRIVESEPDRRVVTALDFGGRGQARGTFTIVPEGAGSRLTWSFDSEHAGLVERWFGLVLDRMVGGDYGKGLAKLKAALESGPR